MDDRTDKFTWKKGDIKKVTMDELQESYAELEAEIERLENERRHSADE